MRSYGHKLRALWNRYKAKESDAALDRFDATVKALHEFHSIRYPDKIVKQGMIISIAWAPGDTIGYLEKAKHGMLISFAWGPDDTGTDAPPEYGVIISEIDNFVIEVLRRARLNPKSLIMKFARRPGVQETVAYQNPQASEWF
jgi:hypothetical protein